MLFIVQIFLALCMLSQGHAAPLPPNLVPEPLKPWVSWVLHGHEENQCPMTYNDATQHICIWSSRLALTLESTQGRFTQQVQVIKTAWVPLPGSLERWPTDVKVDEKPAPVIAHDQTPGVWLSEGTHVVTGGWYYPTMPEYLPVPPNSGLITLTVTGHGIPLAQPDPQGRLWLHPKTAEKRVEDQLDMTVHRLIQDGVPITLETRIELRVAGKKREILLDQPIRAGWIPMSLDSPLPVRIDPDGRLRIQARPGVWNLTLRQRNPGIVTSIEWPKEQVRPWPDEEIWAFAANHPIRIVTVTGVDAIDPQQTLLPQEWRNHPTFRIRPGEQIHFTEKQRGETNQAPDRLTLSREIWLDFSGQGWSIQDHLQGSNMGSWRLEMNPPMELGRVTVDHENQFITRLPDSTRSGVEIRQGTLALNADSRLPMAHGVIPATGWNLDMQKVSAKLHLPPGWHLLHATGANEVNRTWISRWTLLDLFLVLVTALTVSKLWGRLWGGLALVTLALAYPEEHSLAWTLLTLMAAIAIGRVITSTGTLAKMIRFWRGMALLMLVLTALPFLVNQIRQGFYPQLELMYPPQFTTDNEHRDMPQAPPPAATAEDKEEQALQRSSSKARSIKKSAKSYLRNDTNLYDGDSTNRKTNLTQTDPRAMVQTGPGIPQWKWRDISINWNGPVERNQELRLYLLPPWANRIVILLRVLLLLALLVRVADIGRSALQTITQTGGASQTGTKRAMLVLLAGLGIFGMTRDANAEMPEQNLLETLKSRLLEPPTCMPACADLARLRLEADAERLRLHLEIHALKETAIPLPGQFSHWQPREVILDGKPAPNLTRHNPSNGQGTVWMLVPSGIHAVILEGELPRQESLQITLPMLPRWAVAESTAWQVEGIHDNGVTDATLQLRRIRAATESSANEELESTSVVLPPFLEVERRLILGLTWEIETRVRRVTQPGQSVLLELPLLAGESITTSDVRVTDGKVLTRLEPDQMERHWRSSLEVQEAIHLLAPELTQWSEVWRLQVSPIWHMALDGIPVTRHIDDQGHHQPEWRPWPGERVGIHVTRPQGIEGPTLTLEKSELVVTPGEHIAEVKLTLHLRSSRGGQHPIRLPESAVLLNTLIKGQKTSLNQDGRQVMLPITPGKQEIQMNWRQSGGMQVNYVTPQADLGLNGVNATLRITMPSKRWILWTHGPTMGPAVLYWGSLVLILIVAVGLGRITWVPMRTHHWVLLGLGLSTVQPVSAVTLVMWFLLLGWRGKESGPVTRWGFNLRQVILLAWTVAAVHALEEIFKHGLLGYPNMQIAGNHSNQTALQWFQDQTGPLYLEGQVISLPILAYRLLMLGWSLWLASALLNWIRWGWSCFIKDGLWRHPEPKTKPESPASPEAHSN